MFLFINMYCWLSTEGLPGLLGNKGFHPEINLMEQGISSIRGTLTKKTLGSKGGKVKFSRNYRLRMPLLNLMISFLFCLVLVFVYQLTGNIANVKIGILKEGFGLKNSEADVDKMVREAVEQLGSKCGAVVEEVSIPMHSDGNCRG